MYKIRIIRIYYIIFAYILITKFTKMKKLIFAISFFVFSSVVYLSAQCGGRAAYIKTNTTGQPWNTNGNIEAMDRAFGAGNWDALFFETLNPTNTFGGSVYSSIFIEGSDYGAVEFNTFLTANKTLIEAFVYRGGSLWLNAAPNEGGNINLGFGGVNLIQNQFSGCLNVLNSSHNIFNIPSPIGFSHFQGNYAGHAILCPPSLNGNVLLEKNGTGEDVLVQVNWGAGLVLFGGMTMPVWWCAANSCGGPSTCNDAASNNLRSNILTYLAQRNHAACGAVPTLGEWGLIILALVLFNAAALFIRRKSMKIAGTPYEFVLNETLKTEFQSINTSSFIKTFALIAALGIISLLLGIYSFNYSLTNADIPCGMIAAFLLTMLIQKFK